MARLAETVWIPAFAGMTGEMAGMTVANRSGGATIVPLSVGVGGSHSSLLSRLSENCESAIFFTPSSILRAQQAGYQRPLALGMFERLADAGGVRVRLDHVVVDAPRF